MKVNKTLIVGIGGTGRWSLLEIKRLMKSYYVHDEHNFPLIEFLEIDTEFLDKEQKTDSNFEDDDYDDDYRVSLKSKEETYKTEVDKYDMRNFLEEPRKISADDFANKQYLKELIDGVQGNGAGGYGIIGKLALWQHLGDVKTKLESKISNLNSAEYIQGELANYNSYVNNDTFEYDTTDNYDVFVICSLGGGTGKGMFLTIGAMINEIMLNKGITSSLRFLVNYMPTCFDLTGRKVSPGYLNTIKSNQYASFKELEYVLKNGYPIENKLKNIVNLNRGQKYSNEIFTDVLTVSSQKENKQEDIGDYGVVNSVVGQTIVNYIFGGLHEEIRKFFVSNKASFIDQNEIVEDAASTAERVRDYGRMGVYKLTYPRRNLIEYSRNYMRKEIMEDLIIGDLSRVDEQEEVKPSEFAENCAADFFDLVVPAQQLNLNKSYIYFSSLSCQTFEDNWISELNRKISNKLDTLVANQQTQQGKSALEETEDKLLEQFIAGPEDLQNYNKTIFKDSLIEYMIEYGLEKSLRVLQELQEDLEMRITNHPNYNFNQHLKKNKQTIRKSGEEFSFEKDYKQVYSDIRQKKDQLVAEFKDKFANANSQFYKNIQKNLKQDKTNWEENRSLLNKMKVIQDDEKIISPQTRSEIKSLIESSRKMYKKIINHLEKLSLIRSYNKLYQFLAEKASLFKNNKRFLDGKKTNYKNKMEQYANINARQLEILVLGNKKSEFRDFAKNQLLTNDKGLSIYDIEAEINKKIVPQLFAKKLSGEKVDLEELFSEYDRRIDKAENDYSICKHLRDIDKEKRKKYIKKLIDNSSLLGRIAAGKVRVKGVDISTGEKIIQAQDVDLLERLLKNISMGGIDVKETRSKGETQITLTSIDTGLPLCSLEEMYDMQEMYFSKVNDAEDSKYVKHRLHSNTNFTNIEEPLGSTSQIPEKDLPTYINLLLYSRVMKVDNSVYGDDGYVQYWSRSGNYKYLLDENTPPEYGEKERRVLLSTFINDINQRNDWFEKFTKALFRVFKTHFKMVENNLYQSEEMKQKYEAYIKSYFDPEVYTPYFPEVLMQKLLEEGRKQLETGFGYIKFAKKLLEDNELNNARKIKRQSVEGEIELCRSIEEAYEHYERPDEEIIQLYGGNDDNEDKAHQAKQEKVSQEPPQRESEEEQKYWVAIGPEGAPLAEQKNIEEIIDLIESNNQTIYAYDETAGDYVPYQQIDEIKTAYQQQQSSVTPPPRNNNQPPKRG